ncbi:MAG: GMC family oxidoreductase [Ferruginibacter sp.]|nr:GMC family oxidoreductase [Ferruginibacter sp.]
MGNNKDTVASANLNIHANTINTYDAIVIGSGISGGWAAKELTEKGLKTLLIERGRNVRHLVDYPTTNLDPWELPHRGTVPLSIAKEYKTVSKHYSFKEDTLHFFLKDAEQEYIADKPFDWIRGSQVGGRSLLWARHTQRWSDLDFEGPQRDGFAVDWPIRYKDIAPWYSHVEKFAGISGNRDGLAVLPDGEFLPPFEMTCVEKHFREATAKKYTNRHVIIARVANLTEPAPVHLLQGRGKCRTRDLCSRGCPFGGYFSSNSSTIPWAEKTGKLTMLTDGVVQSLIFDEQQNKATGVRVIDTKTRNITEYSAKIIFVNASAINTNLILLNSTSRRFPNGLGNDTGLLGTHIAFHNYRGKVEAAYEGLPDFTTEGRRPGASYMPRFRNLYQQETDFLRGYATVISSTRIKNTAHAGFGKQLMQQLQHPSLGDWSVSAQMMGETIPKKENCVRLDSYKKDMFGLPQLHISVGYDLNDEKMLADFQEQFSVMFSEAGFKQIKASDTQRKPGNENHEMGGVRMGNDPATSLLNKWNQLHSCNNVFVTDGACMTSTSNQNPSLTYMALTARAVDYAFNQLKKGAL